MTKPDDRVIPLCKCRDGDEPLYPIISHDDEKCVICGQPIVTINIDRLLRIEKAAKATDSIKSMLELGDALMAQRVALEDK